MTILQTHIVLSTAHIQEETSSKLSEIESTDKPRIYDDWRNDIICCQYDYGYWVRIPILDPEDPSDTMNRKLKDFPKDLADCIEHALQFGAKWILFDRDEEALGNLMVYDW